MKEASDIELFLIQMSNPLFAGNKINSLTGETIKEKSAIIKPIKPPAIITGEEAILDTPPIIALELTLPVNKPYWITNPLPHINTEYFSETSKHFIKHGTYTFFAENTQGWRAFWYEEIRRCLEGYTVAGVRITGRHYFYLNYTRLSATDHLDKTQRKSKRKKPSFPRFLDMDYYYFHEIDLAREAGEDIALLKARRTGFSLKNAALGLYEYTWFEGSSVMYAAYLDTYAEIPMEMWRKSADFLVQYTPFGLQRTVNLKNAEYVSGYREIINGQEILMGRNSSVIARSFMQNTSAGIGRSFFLVCWEESGKFNNFLKARAFTKDALKDGEYSVGMNIFFGTGGDMESGASNGFAEVYNNPHKYDCRAFDAKEYDKEDPNYAGGLFFGQDWLLAPNLDDFGYAQRSKVVSIIELHRSKLVGAKNAAELEFDKTQRPLTPREAFLIPSSNVFPKHELAAQITRILSNKDLSECGHRGRMKYDKNNKAYFEEDSSLVEAAFPYDVNSSEGCVVIYEEPEEVMGEVPAGLYIASTDPYMQDQTVGVGSLGSTFIYKKFLKAGSTSNWIVAEYTGRPETTNMYYDTVIALLEYYNAKSLYENQFRDMKAHLENKKKLYLLAKQPTRVANMASTEVKRVYGIHMVPSIKMHALAKAKDFLIADKMNEDSAISRIFSVYLLRELLAYIYDKGNFDRVSSFLLLMLYLEELELREVSTVEDRKEDPFDALMEQMYGVASLYTNKRLNAHMSNPHTDPNWIAT